MQYPSMSEREIRNAKIARKAGSEGMVLLKNENHTLPLTEKTIAMFGSGAVRTIRGGTGSGDPFNGGVSGGGDVLVNQSPRYHINIMDAFLSEGFQVVNRDSLSAYAEKYDAKMVTNSYNPMAVFSFPEYMPSKEEIESCAKQTDTAMYILSRNTGEGHDRNMTYTITEDGVEYEMGDYCLSAYEKEMIRTLCATFSKVVLVLNSGGPVDLSEVCDLPGLGAILSMCQAGQEGGLALLDVITGQVTPSGKLTDTWAKKYADYPASETFSNNDNNVDVEKYEEGIYVGYRYFDTFGIEPLYPFGYGLSYTSFSLGEVDASLSGETLSIKVTVTNTGDTYAGKEVVQVYVSAPDGKLEKPFQVLAAFQKTRLLTPGEKETLTLSFPFRRVASYDSESAAYLLEKGEYKVRLGVSSRDTMPVCRVRVLETLVTEQLRNEMPLQMELKEISKAGANGYQPDEDFFSCPAFTLKADAVQTENHASPYWDEKVTTYTTDPDYKAVMPYESVCLVEKKKITLKDVYQGKATLAELVAQLSPLQLATLNCGTGWGVQNDSSPIIGSNSATIPGAAGETVDMMEEFGIPSMVVADGPGGVRVGQHFTATDLATGEKVETFHFCTAWPVGTLLAQSFDEALLEEVGKAFSEELEEIGIAVLLGPGMNIHRDPLCGRNFEYYSEDPLLTGKMGAAIVKGIQSRDGIGGCIKHFAANNQETNRNSEDSVVSERALREIYLKGFEIAVKESKPMTIMTSYNRINGIPAADHYSMNTNIARGEWGFDGLIMTDWNGGRSTPYISMHAGNDLIMPGGSARIMNILMAFQTIPPVFQENGGISYRTERIFIPISVPEWNSFLPDEKGSDEITAPVLADCKIEFVDGILTIDGEAQYAVNKLLLTKNGPKFQKELPITEKIATVAAEQKSITYRGIWQNQAKICAGDVQRCAINNLSVIMRSLAMKQHYPDL